MFKSLADKSKTLERQLGDRFGTDISTPRGRRRAWIHFHLLDHGILRSFWTNFFRVAPGVWRSNQPSPRRLRRLKAKGIKTVLNLRGPNKTSPYLFEKETCDAIGLTLVDYQMRARHLGGRKNLLGLLDLFETLQKPFVMHCKSGADRAGLAAALYLLHIEGASIETARRQLGLKFVHVKSFQTGILDFFLDSYEADTKNAPMPVRDWIETRYRAKKLSARFHALRGGS